MTDPTTPVDRLRAEITERLELARRAAKDWGHIGVAVQTSDRSQVPFVAMDSVTDHIAANDPARVFKDCERDLRVLDRHAPQPSPEADEPARCVGCTHDNLSAWPCWNSWPCDEITDLADVYGVDLTGGAS